jgi:hypothetical protein
MCDQPIPHNTKGAPPGRCLFAPQGMLLMAVTFLVCKILVCKTFAHPFVV